MTHDFKLDTSSSKGWGLDNYDIDDPAEHGEIISDYDLKILCEQHGFSYTRSKGTINTHRLIYQIRPENAITMVLTTGGESRIHAVDLSIYPDGLVFPMNLFDVWPKDINLVVIDFDHQMSWSWARNTDNFRFKNIEWEKLLQMMSFNKQGPAAQLLDALHDFKLILKQIISMTSNNKIWAMGHCNSCSLLAKYHDFFAEPCEIDGFVFASPAWNNTWKTMLPGMKYFFTPLQKPLIALQHEGDRARVTGIELARAIVKQSASPNGKFVQMSGGIDLGCPHFSMGHHAFRGIEQQLVSEIVDFVKSNTK